MLKETRTYTNFNGEEVTEDFYFNLTKAEILEMELGHTGGLAEYIQQVINAKEVTEIMTIFKKILLLSYGKKSPDGRRFIKSKELQDEFSQTQAYSDLFMELATDADKAAKFINGITPSEYNADLKAIPNA